MNPPDMKNGILGNEIRTSQRSVSDLQGSDFEPPYSQKVGRRKYSTCHSAACSSRNRPCPHGNFFQIKQNSVGKPYILGFHNGEIGSEPRHFVPPLPESSKCTAGCNVGFFARPSGKPSGRAKKTSILPLVHYSVEI